MSDRHTDGEQGEPLKGSFEITYQPKAPRGESRRDNSKTRTKSWTAPDVAAVTIQALLLAMTAFIASIYYDQLVEMRKQVEQSDEHFRVAQRPWLQVTEAEKIGEFSTDRATAGKIRLTIRNSGVTPATEVYARIKGMVVDAGAKWKIEYDNPPPEGPGSLGVLAPNFFQHISSKAFVPCRRPPCRLDATNEDREVFYFGYIRYADRFGYRYCSTYCLRVKPIIGKSGFVVCPSHNDIYEIDDDLPCPPQPADGP